MKYKKIRMNFVFLELLVKEVTQGKTCRISGNVVKMQICRI